MRVDGRRCRLVVVLAVLARGGLGCATIAPELVEERLFAVMEAADAKLAVLPFYPSANLSRSVRPGGLQAWEATALVTRFVTEAVAQRRVTVIPESDVQLAFASEGQVTPRLDATSAARLAADRFGATGVLLGVVNRYREREGSAFASQSTASAEFVVTLYDAPAGRRIWTGRFNQTQPDLSRNLFTATRYPGGGTRFLTVAELARWGAQLIAERLPIGSAPPR
jgi:hypothetical protein